MMLLRSYAVLVLFLITMPILIMIPISFNSGHTLKLTFSDYSLKWYENFFNNELWLESLGRSISTALLVAALSTVIGGMAALSVNRLSFPGKNIFMNLMVAPMVIPVIVVGIALYHSFSFLKLNDTVLGVVLGHSIVAIPLVFVTMMAGLKGVQRDLELAAQSLGSTPIGAFFKVTFPLLRLSIFASFFFAFSTSLDEVIISIFVAGPSTKTLPILLWENMRTQLEPTIAVAATILILGTITAFLAPKVIDLFKKALSTAADKRS
ncbi:ABC transporter permease [Neobacillus sp. 19]|uniref:ABC transporter permease n=1 Tax=Neobacillus sp. 19 TaxID=3394458 RepID=UPI003BF65614